MLGRLALLEAEFFHGGEVASAFGNFGLTGAFHCLEGKAVLLFFGLVSGRHHELFGDFFEIVKAVGADCVLLRVLVYLQEFVLTVSVVLVDFEGVFEVGVPRLDEELHVA
jgi:hypothetical protein